MNSKELSTERFVMYIIFVLMLIGIGCISYIKSGKKTASESSQPVPIGDRYNDFIEDHPLFKD